MSARQNAFSQTQVKLSPEDRGRLVGYLAEAGRAYLRQVETGGYSPGLDRKSALAAAHESDGYARALVAGYTPTSADVARWCVLLSDMERAHFPAGQAGDDQYHQYRPFLHRLRSRYLGERSRDE